MGFEICFKASKANGNFYKLQQVVQGVKTVQFLILSPIEKFSYKNIQSKNQKWIKVAKLHFYLFFLFLKEKYVFFCQSFVGSNLLCIACY